MDDYIDKPIQARTLYKAVEGVSRSVPEPAGPPPAEQPPSALWNWSAALARAGGDREFLQHVVQLFFTECPKQMTEIRESITRGEARSLKHSAHTLKASLNFFGAKAAAEAALRLEMLGQAGTWAGAEEAWSLLEREIQHLRPALSAFSGK